MSLPRALQCGSVEDAPFAIGRQAIRKRGDPGGAWSGTLLLSKLRPPMLNADTVPRSALIGRLEQGRSHLLSLLHSPAGFGKTTLLAQFYRHLEAAGEAAAWLALDEDDRDPERFVAYLTSAVARAVAGPAPPDTETLATLLNALSADGPPTFVFLDDYHLAQTRQNDQVIEWLLRHRPQRLRLVVSMRGWPTFPVSRLRAEGNLIEFDEEDLRFRLDDGGRLFGDELDSDGIAAVFERTEGWPVALQLARLWASRHGGTPSPFPGFTGSASEMAAYLAEEIVAGLPEASRDLLLATAIVQELPLDLARHLTGGRATSAMLAELVALNVPIFAVPGHDDRFRYHPIFREFLAAQLAVSDRHDKRAQHLLASQWFLDHGQIVDAIEHAAAAGEDERAIEMAGSVSWVRQISRGRSVDVRRVLAALPDDSICRHPRLAATLAFLKYKDGNYKAGSRLFQDLEAMFPRGPDRAAAFGPDATQDLQLLDALHAAYVDQGIAPEAIRPLETLLVGADPTDYGFRGTLTTTLGLLYFRNGRLLNSRATFLASMDEFDSGNIGYGTVFIPIHLAMIAIAQAQLGEARSWIASGSEKIRAHFSFDPALHHQLDLIAAELHYLSGDLASAKLCLSAAMAAIEQTEGWTELYIAAYRTMAAIAFAEHGIDAARGVLDAGDAAASRLGLPRLSFNLASKRVQLLLAAGALAEAKRAAEDSGLAAIAADRHYPVTSWIERDEAIASLARLAMAHDDPAEALERLAALERRSHESDAGLRLIQCRILKAIAFRKAGEPDLAVSSMRQALMDAMREGLVRPFLDEGPAVRTLLKDTVAHIGVGAMTEALYAWISQLLIAFDGGNVNESVSETVGSAIFTPTEFSVLQELRTGGSNKQIARRLSTTENTVKFHMKNIFRKLGVNTRRLAIEVALQRNLLPS